VTSRTAIHDRSAFICAIDSGAILGWSAHLIRVA
jgi:hypothetical protein